LQRGRSFDIVIIITFHATHKVVRTMSDALTRMRIALADQGLEPKRAEQLLFWATSFLNFTNFDQPDDIDRTEVEKFLEHLSRDRHAGSATRQRALEAIERLYRHTDAGVPAWLKVLIEERRPTTMPNVLSRDEVRRVLRQLLGREWLAAALVYSTGIRLVECVRLRVRDLDLEAGRLAIRESSDHVQRSLSIPRELLPKIQAHIDDLRRTHIAEIGQGGGEATLPPAIAARQPNAARSWGWQYLFPERRGNERKAIHHMDPQQLHQRFERAATEARIYRRVTGHVLRNSFALHMIQRGVPVRRVEQILGTTRDECVESMTAVDAGIAPLNMPQTEVGPFGSRQSG
jgi:integrase